ncbi:hypothetical protein COEREDRAFT_83688 [Coemansia reversa NRRL 1564]|uniref:Uncharacterized protein n=1 Tax=Coemansia reversa (strain ATCC 12441 / NRRL 1564) TaxID=763665 RepID=A0A2G5B282_COERN|nr:hypothetical protein COEREDRAFT_83688 [Coemansia reversa NRRL 1564]|eukprot:PIA13105.1 hypothetical protein COEREDRAFT_83688 [Coemansia reversa NRRL 1564]
MADYPICQWRIGIGETIARRKCFHMDTERNFRSAIASEFQSKYKLLRRLAINLHKALFAYAKCKGALNPKELGDASDMSDLEESDHFTEPAIEPLVAHNNHFGDILLNLQNVMDKYKKYARARLAE